MGKSNRLVSNTAGTMAVIPEAPPERTRSVHIEIADNGYVVRIVESNFKEVELVFTSQASMLRTIKEATTMEAYKEED